jgi:hypothetical protein
MSGKLISVAVSDPDLIGSVNTIREAKITHRKGTMKIFYVEVLDGLLVFLRARKSKVKCYCLFYINFHLKFFKFCLTKT